MALPDVGLQLIHTEVRSHGFRAHGLMLAIGSSPNRTTCWSCSGCRCPWGVRHACPSAVFRRAAVDLYQRLTPYQVDGLHLLRLRLLRLFVFVPTAAFSWRPVRAAHDGDPLQGAPLPSFCCRVAVAAACGSQDQQRPFTQRGPSASVHVVGRMSGSPPMQRSRQPNSTSNK